MANSSPSKLYPISVDLTNCDREPIHIIGKIQNHGFLVACDAESQIISRCSDNLYALFHEKPQELLGKPLDSILSKDFFSETLRGLDSKKVSYGQITLNSGEFTLIAHRSTSELVLEFEKSRGILYPLNYQLRLSEIVSEINNHSDLTQMSNRAASLIKEYLEYDRVMIYQFDANWNGKVIAEQKEDHLESWLGLQYPATDIPKQARELFLKQGVRIINDVSSKTVDILSSKTYSEDASLDLTRSELRAVSPIHIEYLGNMGVQATLTAAIVCENTLWGLVACHHYTPKYVNPYQRLSCKFLTQVFATRMQLETSDRSLKKLKRNSLIRSTLIDQIDQDEDIAFGLSAFEYTLMDLTDCTGAAICMDNEVTSLGSCPSTEQILEMTRAIRSLAKSKQYHTNSFSMDFEEALSYKEIASGVMCMFISNTKNNALLWFKPEVVKTVDWAGNPEKAVSLKNDQRLSPRKSFKKWTEEQTGKSKPWEDYEISAAASLQQSIFEIIIQKYEEIRALNEKLKRAYEDMESFSYSVSHDLRAPLRGIDGFAQIMKEEYYESLDEFGKSTLETIIASAGKMNGLIDDILAYSSLGRQALAYRRFSAREAILEVYETLQDQYPNASLHVETDLSEMYGDRPTILMLLQNLIENALKYSSKEREQKVEIGMLDKQTYFISDNGIGFDTKHGDSIFEVFVRLVDSGFTGSGIGLAIAKRVVEKHKGAIWAESTVGKGSTFYFKLNASDANV